MCIPLATFGWYFNECACGALNSKIYIHSAAVWIQFG